MEAGDDRARETQKWGGMWVLPDLLMLKEPQKRALRLLVGVMLVSLLLILLLDSATRNGTGGHLPGVSELGQRAGEGALRPLTEESGLGASASFNGSSAAESGGEPSGAWVLENRLARELEGILSRIRGVGAVSVRVMVDGDQVRDYTVQASGGQPLLHQLKRPAIKGVLVVAEGAGDPVIKEEVVRGVQAALGVPIHLIRVSEGIAGGTVEMGSGQRLPGYGGESE